MSIQTWIDHVHPDDLAVTQTAFDQHITGALQSYECEFRMRHKHGGWVWVLASGKVVQRDASGRALRISGIHLDVSARYSAMDKANRATRHLQSTMDAIPSLVSYWDANLINQFANKAYTDYFGATSEFMLGQHVSKIFGEELYRSNLPFLQAALRGEEQNFQREIPSPDGKPTRYFEAKYLPDVVNGMVVGIYAFVLDISDMKLSEKKLIELNTQLAQRTLEAEVANSSKSTFLANISHEMRTPINAIVGVQQILARTPLSEDQKSFLSASTSSAQSLLALVNDILDMSKIEAGKLDIVESAFEVAGVTQALFTMLGPTVNAQKVRLLLDIAPEVPPVLLGDAMRLRQVMLNLGSNAVKFTETGFIRVSIAVLSRGAQGVLLHFAVQDTGIGIPPEKQAHIFGAFNQADSTTTRQYGGTGLGLSISKALVSSMGGELTLQSEAGKGSTFSFDLWLGVAPAEALLALAKTEPSAQAQLSAPPASSAQPERAMRLQGLHILVVEDQPINRMVVERMLVTEGASVEMVDNGQKAVDAVHDALQRGNLYDAVLMDMQMPVLNGLEATRAIRLTPGLGSDQLPILALTANAMTENVQDCLDAGMNGHIAKPIRADELVQQLIACTAKA